MIFKNIFNIVRSFNCLLTSLVILVGYYISGINYHISSIVFLTMTGFFTAAAGNVINDIYDFQSDKINHPNRPLPSGGMTLSQAKILYSILIILSFLSAVQLTWSAFIIYLSSTILLFLYSYKLKSILFLSNLLIASITALAFAFGAAENKNIKSVLFPILFAFLINLAREIVKDFEDLKGDELVNTLTLPQKNSGLAKFIVAFTLSIIVLILVILIFVNQNLYFNLIILLLVIPIVFSSLYQLYKNDVKKMSLMLKICMIFGLISFL